MQSIDFYSDHKFCSACDKYVTYLMSIHASYCTQCGSEVRLFSKSDWKAFNHSTTPTKKPKRRQQADKEMDFGKAQ